MVTAMSNAPDTGVPTELYGVRIGIAPAHGLYQGSDLPSEAGSNLDLVDGPPPPPPPAAPKGDADWGKLTWAKYMAWRKTKCPPREPDTYRHGINRDEVNQATLEMVGELAEAVGIIVREGVGAFYSPNRVKLIDEIGDAIFCTAWAISAWGFEAMLADYDIELDQAFGGHDRDHIVAAQILGNAPLEFIDRQMGVGMNISLICAASAGVAQSAAGDTANALKKILYQGRQQDHEGQAARCMVVLRELRILLLLADCPIRSALVGNMQKLDKRFPNGWVPGGGIR